jgi:hypothetical protein
MSSRPDRSDGELALDRLPDPAEVIDVLPLAGVSTSPAEAREPHRHDYHELIWVRSGSGHHLIDGGRVPGWLLAGQCGRTVAVPAGETARLDAVIDALRAEVSRPRDAQSLELQRQRPAPAPLRQTARIGLRAASRRRALRGHAGSAAQIAHTVGFSESPTGYRARVRGHAKLSA